MKTESSVDYRVLWLEPVLASSMSRARLRGTLLCRGLSLCVICLVIPDVHNLLFWPRTAAENFPVPIGSSMVELESASLALCRSRLFSLHAQYPSCRRENQAVLRILLPDFLFSRRMLREPSIHSTEHACYHALLALFIYLCQHGIEKSELVRKQYFLIINFCRYQDVRG